MTAHRTILFTTILAMMMSESVPAQQRRAPSEPFPRDLDRYLETVRERWQIPGIAVAVVRNDSVLVAKGYGVRVLGKPDRVDARTVFDIASIAKSFTATAAAMLVDRGRLRWDDPVRVHLPHLRLPTDSLTETATLRDFLSHRTGLESANMMWMLSAIDRAEVVRRMQYLRVTAPFRQRMVYSNIGYAVAGEAIAAAAGTTFESMLRDMVIAPLHLSSTTWTYEQAAGLPNVASPHVTIDGQQRVIPRELQRQAIAPAASVQSSVEDLARWMRLHLNNGTLDGVRYVSDSTMRAMHGVQAFIPTTPAMRAARLVEDTVIGYGMGWQVNDYRGHRAVWHTGNGNGQIAWMTLLPDDRLGIVVLVNTWSAPMVHFALVNRIADTYLGYEPRDWAADAFRTRLVQDSARRARDRTMVAMRSREHTPLPLEAYVGEYTHPVFGPLFVRRDGAQLTLQVGAGQVADLEYHGGNTFYALWRDTFSREYFSTHVEFAIKDNVVVSLTSMLNADQVTAFRARNSTK